MSTTVRIPDDLMKAVKLRAQETGRSPTDVIEDALRTTLSQRDRASERGLVEIPTYGSKGLLPGVDLDDSASAMDRMEARD